MSEERSSRIVVNGQEYGSVEEMPADVRALYERALRVAADAGVAGSQRLEVTTSPTAVDVPGQVTVQTVRTSTRFMVDGKEYGSVDELPPAARAALRDALAAGKANRLAYPADRPSMTPPEAEYEPPAGRRLRFTASVSPLRLALWGAAILFLIYYLFLRRG